MSYDLKTQYRVSGCTTVKFDLYPAGSGTIIASGGNVAASDLGNMTYGANFPSLAAGWYDVVGKDTGNNVPLGTGTLYWNGTAVVYPVLTGNLPGNATGLTLANIAAAVGANISASNYTVNVPGYVGGVTANVTFANSTVVPSASAVAAAVGANISASNYTVNVPGYVGGVTANVTFANSTVNPNTAAIVAAIQAATVVSGTTIDDLLKDLAAALAGNATNNGTVYKLPGGNTTRLTVSAGSASLDRVVTRT